ncbi:T6SS immunity protein Tdi1 domain-containing protein [Vibrio parahaemolyticus]|uniref:T6SS immunity protein Tdi1 domain-containing protein n=1 Tax=Vibrio parahaemolyticus TaxID=670 RepID=UPI0015E033FB|nr:T6SS immunity protein Tdi1 domain-containing protein [Vibrio parahaemolyticus]
MYHILKETKGQEYLDGWADITGDFDQIKGYSDLGDVFLINSVTGEVGILLTMENSFHPMGINEWEKFEDQVLTNSKFQEDVLHKSFIKRVKEVCGVLEKEQVYIATPYPCVGGSGAPDTYKKGNVWVYLSISAQTWKQI